MASAGFSRSSSDNVTKPAVSLGRRPRGNKRVRNWTRATGKLTKFNSSCSGDGRCPLSRISPITTRTAT
jgi:hypothetical protein